MSAETRRPHLSASDLVAIQTDLFLTMAEIGAPERRRVLVPNDLPAESPIVEPPRKPKEPQREPVNVPEKAGGQLNLFKVGDCPMHKRLRYCDLEALGIVRNRVTLGNWIRHHGFPTGQLTGPNSRTWSEEEVQAWLDSRPTEQKKRAKPPPRPRGRPRKWLKVPVSNGYKTSI